MDWSAHTRHLSSSLPATFLHLWVTTVSAKTSSRKEVKCHSAFIIIIVKRTKSVGHLPRVFEARQEKATLAPAPPYSRSSCSGPRRCPTPRPPATRPRRAPPPLHSNAHIQPTNRESTAVDQSIYHHPSLTDDELVRQHDPRDPRRRSFRLSVRSDRGGGRGASAAAPGSLANDAHRGLGGVLGGAQLALPRGVAIPSGRRGGGVGEAVVASSLDLWQRVMTMMTMTVLRRAAT